MLSNRDRRALASLGIGLGTALPACLLLVPHLSFVPFWDAGDYFFRLRRATLSGFAAESYHLSGHPTFLFALLMSAPIALFPASVEALHLFGMLLFALSVAAFRSLAARLRPGPEATLAALCYSLCPALVGNVLYFSPDLGVACFFPIYLSLLLGGPGPLSAIAGSLLANTKELGFVLYAASVPIYLFSLGWRRAGWRRLTYLLLPALVTIGIRSALETPPLRQAFLNIVELNPLNFLWEAKVRWFLLDLFVLSFSWVPAMVLAIGGAAWLRGERRSRPCALFLALVFAACIYSITRVPTHNNVRYMLPAFLPLYLLAYYVLPGIVARRRARIASLSLFAPLLLASNYRSFDPISSMVFSPLRFGERTVWSLEGRSVRDQLAYNLEYLMLHHLSNDLLAYVRPAAGSVFAGERAWDYYSIFYVDPRTFSRSVRKPGDIGVVRLQPNRFHELSVPGSPGVVHFVDYPNLHDPEALPALARLGYVETERKTFERNGYALEYVRLEKAKGESLYSSARAP